MKRKRDAQWYLEKAVCLLASIVLTNDRTETPRQRRALKDIFRNGTKFGANAKRYEQ